jgi:phosphate transport system permease protein
VRAQGRRIGEWLIERIIQAAGAAAIVFVALIFFFLLRDGLPLLKTTSLWSVLSGSEWRPTSEPPQFGMLPLLLGSLYVTAGALVVAVPLGLGAAVFISEVASPRIQEILKPAVEVLATIPSVVFGFLGLMLVGPWLAERLNLPEGRWCRRRARGSSRRCCWGWAGRWGKR